LVLALFEDKLGTIDVAVLGGVGKEIGAVSVIID